MSAQTKCDRCGYVGGPSDFRPAFVPVAEINPRPLDLCVVCRNALVEFLRPIVGSP